MRHLHMIEPGRRQREVERGGDVADLHRRAQLPRHDEAREVIQHGREVVPTPADHLQIGEVRLPELVGCGGLVPELVGGFDHDVGRAGDQVLGLEQAVDGRLRDEVAPLVGEAHRQLTWLSSGSSSARATI